MKIGLITSFSVTLLFCAQLVYAQAPGNPQVLQVQKGGGLTSVIPCTIPDPGDPTYDAPGKPPSGLNCNSWQDLVEIVQFFINSALVIATLLAVLSFTWAGWLYLTSQGDSGKIKRAHGIFLMVLKGFIFMGIAYLLVLTVLNSIAKPEFNKLQ
jgi:hypothetical protein